MLYRRISDNDAGSMSVLYEVATKDELTNIGQWWYDDPNDRIYIYGNSYIEDADIKVYRPNSWERVASKKYIQDKYSQKNVINIGADRHFLALDNGYSDYSKWPSIVSAKLSPMDGYTSCRKYQVNGKKAWLHEGMGPGGFDSVGFGGFAVLDFQYNPNKIVASLYYEDGTIMNNDPANHTDDDVAGASDWLGNLTMDIAWICPYGNCDFFNRANHDDLDVIPR